MSSNAQPREYSTREVSRLLDVGVVAVSAKMKRLGITPRLGRVKTGQETFLWPEAVILAWRAEREALATARAALEALRGEAR